jgi:hypothetical protein
MITTHQVRVRTFEAAQPDSQAIFVFPDGRGLAATEIAALRMFAAAGIRPRCVLTETDRPPDPAAYRAALFAQSAASSTAAS